jgi:hypothetical protein
METNVNSRSCQDSTFGISDAVQINSTLFFHSAFVQGTAALLWHSRHSLSLRGGTASSNPSSSAGESTMGPGTKPIEKPCVAAPRCAH